MSDLRHDPVTNQWVAIAQNRGERPMEFIAAEQTRQRLICPFCKGNEDETPQSSVAYKSDGSELTSDDDPSSWTVRVVPNKFPAFPALLDASVESANGNGLVEKTDHGPYQNVHCGGEQELILCSPRHVLSLSELTKEEVDVSFLAYQHRIQHMETLEHVKHAMLFLNCRHAAGASLSHVHTQLIGSPVVSDFLLSRAQRNQSNVEQHGVSLIESLMNWEIQQQTRLILETENFAVFCPYASRFAFQTWIVPKRSTSKFQDCPPAMREELASLACKMVTRFEHRLSEPGYNMLLHIAPFEMAENDHWYVELFPRVTRAAGFEWGTDIWVNPVSPEIAARRIKED